MNPKKAIPTLIGLLVITPIWYYLVYQILDRVNASELMWFLFWVYVPAGFFVKFATDAWKDSK